MEDVICKIVMLENEINAEIDHLVDLKREIREVISAVKNLECQTLLELVSVLQDMGADRRPDELFDQVRVRFAPHRAENDRSSRNTVLNLTVSDYLCCVMIYSAK